MNPRVFVKKNRIIHNAYSLLSQCLLGKTGKMGEPQNFKIHLSRTTTLTSLFTTSLHFLPPTLKLAGGGGWFELLTQDGRLSQHMLSFPSLYSLQAFTLLRMASPTQIKVFFGLEGDLCLERVLSVFLSSRNYICL